jgi:ribosomal protein S18 acetylase RimI-like enzyme
MLPKDITLKDQIAVLMRIDRMRVTDEHDYSWPFESFQSEISNEESRLFEWSSKPGSEELDGFVICRMGYDGECEIMHLACQNKGCGYSMFTAWIEWAKLSGIKKVFLEFHEKNAAAHKLFTKLGFEIIAERERYYRDGGKAILMTLLI